MIVVAFAAAMARLLLNAEGMGLEIYCREDDFVPKLGISRSNVL